MLTVIFPRNPEEKITLACAIALCYKIVTGAINYLLSPVLGFGNIWDTVCIYALCMLIVLRAFRASLLRQTVDTFIVLGFISLFIGLTYCDVQPKSTQYSYLNRYVPYFFGFCFPAYIFFRAIQKPELLTCKFRALGLIISLSALLTVTLMYKFMMQEKVYSMVFGYLVLTGTVLMTDDLIEKFRLSTALAISSNLLIILFYGSRGPMLCYVVFLLVSIFAAKKMSNIKKIFYAIFLATATLLLHRFMFEIAENIIRFANRFGFKARTIEKMIHDKMTEGRFFDVLFDSTNHISPFGLGVAGDTNIFGMYSHNIFFEILINFGWIFGTLVICYVMFFLIYGVVFSKNNNFRRICTVLFCCSFVKLLVTGSFITDSLLFACLAVSTTSFFSDHKFHLLR